MQIKRLVIENFKSIERIELIEPNPFTVFVGPNGSGKSNIFEALEFGNRLSRSNSFDTLRLFGGADALVRRAQEAAVSFLVDYTYSEEPWNLQQSLRLDDKKKHESLRVDKQKNQYFNTEEGSKLSEGDDVSERPQLIGTVSYNVISIDNQFLDRFSRLAAYERKPRIDYSDDLTLTTNASNLEPVLKRVLSNSILDEEIHEWFSLFIPGFKSIKVVEGPFDSRDTLLVYEQTVEKPFTKDLISDGTYNILALLTAVYQSDEPQFLCIEEPENGLHPQVIMSLVEFFRKQCAEKGHYIWLNTHSEAVVRLLTTDEIVLVDKQDGSTKTRQIKGKNIYDIPTDEAWLTGTLGGGLPW